MAFCSAQVAAAKATTGLAGPQVTRTGVSDANQVCRFPGALGNVISLQAKQAAELRLSCRVAINTDLGLGFLLNRNLRTAFKAFALPRYPNHNTPYDPLEDPELDMPSDKMLKKGDPGTFQATIKGVMPVGYWVTMPSGKEAYLPAQDIGFLGGLNRLRKIFKEGDEVTVRIVTRGSSGREVLSLKIPDPNKPDPPPKPLRKEFLPGSSLAARRRRYQQQ